ncbi:MAG: undecaprenyl/decaprenyl-phosphate alpha-N-acetylglucosaminyl 1-phosphate transferase [Victivallales bacterium]|nr:undecaprenyl/decaprenyl-phosphate alpha-N-acetylglucosaminyl 1-phosphate transferase [Victivallales bacterium]
MNWSIPYLMAFGGATVLALVFTPLARALAPWLQLWDKPQSEHHKNHTKPTPVAGGLAMWLSWAAVLFGGLAVALLAPALLPEGLRPALKGIGDVKHTLCVVMLCATGLMAMGLRDDRKPMGAGLKFFFQFLAAGLTAAFGPRIFVAHCPPVLAWAITTLWIATVINAMNFFDNMDGLAGGTSFIAFVFLFTIAALRGQYFVALLTVTAAGAALGFLRYNWPHASIFMGDSGSHFLGYLLAVSCVMTTFYKPADTPTALSMLIPVLVLAIPLCDAATVVIIRLRLHKPIYVGDNRHISHRFVKLGLSRPVAVFLVWLLAFITGAGALALLWLPPFGAWIVLAQFAAMMAIILILQFQAAANLE